MKKYLLLLIVTGVLIADNAGAQFRRYGRTRRYPPVERRVPPSSFKPAASLSVGYGWPNLDKDQLYQFYNFAQGSASQTGVLYGSLDYQFSRTASMGIAVLHGKVSAPYYEYNSTSTVPALNGSLESWSIMLNMVRYIPAGRTVKPYIKTAIGVNIWTQNYADQNGYKVPLANPGSLAYQASLGVKFNLDKHSGLFIEAGYGKYILGGGLTFKF